MANKVSRECTICGKDYGVWPYRVKSSKFCSFGCRNVGYTGRKIPERTGEKGSNWNGGKTKDGNGYIYIYSPNHPLKNFKGYVYEHRLVMEKHIGRYLLPEEVVHHINGDCDDNRLSNLMLFPMQSAHTSYHNETQKKSQLKTVKKVIIYEERSI